MRTQLDQKWGFLRVLEIGVAFSFGIKVCLELPSLKSLYSTYGFAQARIGDLYSISAAPALNILSGRVIFDTDARVAGALLFILIAAASTVPLLCGLGRPWTAAAAWFSQIVLFNSTQLTAYGADGFLLVITFYCFVTTFLWKKNFDDSETIANLCQNTLLAHVSIVYLASGLAKLKGVHWWDGSAFWFAIHQPQFHTPLTELLIKLSRTFPLSPFVSWTTLLFEVSYPLLSLWISTRRIALGMAIVFHIMIGFFMGLWFFSVVMCSFVIAANYSVLPNRVKDLLLSKCGQS